MTVRKVSFIILVLTISACKVKSDYFTNCECEKIRVDDEVEITDNFERYSIKFPNEEWLPYAHNNKLGDGIVGGIFKDDSFKIFGVVEMRKADDWKSIEEQQAEIAAKYNVIESGLTKVNGVSSYWNLVEEINESIPTLTLYITTEHPTENLFYTLNLSVSQNEFGKKELCELENLLQTFKTK